MSLRNAFAATGQKLAIFVGEVAHIVFLPGLDGATRLLLLAGVLLFGVLPLLAPYIPPALILCLIWVWLTAGGDSGRRASSIPTHRNSYKLFREIFLLSLFLIPILAVAGIGALHTAL